MTDQTGETIDILLATYNGEAFLDEQLDSIAAQTHGDWRLIARDDGSTDRTPEILDAFRTRHPDKVVVLEDGDGNLGVAPNFSRLMEHSDADYIMFCDQDDVWLPEKVAESHAAMRELELRYGSGTPLLVHTDLSVVDQDLKPIHHSFWRYQRLDPECGRSLASLLIQNVVTGCAAMANRRLKDVALPLPHDVRMHDWWLALVAAAFGCCHYVPRPLVLYRQHGANALGEKGWGLRRVVRLALTAPFETLRAKRKILRISQEQAQRFLTSYGTTLSEPNSRIVKNYAEIGEKGFIGRRLAIIRGGFWLTGTLKNLGLLVCV